MLSYSYSWTVPNTNSTVFSYVDGEYTLELCVPGYTREDIEVSVEDGGVISIEGENDRFGEFEKQYFLPEDISINKIAASVKDGILTITAPKQEKKKNRIEIT